MTCLSGSLEQGHIRDGSVMCKLLASKFGLLKRHGPFVAFCMNCKIMLYGITYTYYSVKTVKICFHVPFRRLTLYTHRPRGIFETVVGVAKSPEGNA